MGTSHVEETSRASGVVSAMRSCLWLLLSLLIVWPLFAWYGFSHFGQAGVFAAVVAGGVCWIGGALSLVLAGIWVGPRGAVYSTLGGSLFRTMLPLVVGTLLHQAGGELARAGVFGMILLYYFVALITETLLSVQMVNASSKAASSKTMAGA